MEIEKKDDVENEVILKNTMNNQENLIRIAQAIELEERFSLTDPHQIACILRIRIEEAKKIMQMSKNYK